jgi:hypothetical protein
MSCGKVWCFLSSPAGFVRMELKAKGIVKFIPPRRFGGKYVLQRFVIGVGFECLCPAKIHLANGFLEKKIGQVCPANVRLRRFDSEGTRGKIEFCDRPLRKTTIRPIIPT